MIYGAGHKVECGGETDNSSTPGRNGTSTELQILSKSLEEYATGGEY